MLDPMDFICPVLRSTLAETIFTFFGYFGRGALGAILGLALLGHGYFYKNQRSLRAGITVVAVVIVTAGAAELLKHLLPLPRIVSQTGYGILSGRTAMAFGLASALGLAIPGLSPLFFALATLAGISRLYLAAQSIWNVAGGATIGLACGLTLAKTLMPRKKPVSATPLRLAAWIAIYTLGFGSLIFFYTVEKNIAAHLVTERDAPAATTAQITFDFGTPEVRPFLRYGWSHDERWDGGKRSVVWANGLASEIVMNLTFEKDYQFRFQVFPLTRKGPACQRVEVRVNGLVVANILLERGWHWYRFDVPKTTVHTGRNFVQFFYDYAETPKTRPGTSDERTLSVAFDILQALPKS